MVDFRRGLYQTYVTDRHTDLTKWNTSLQARAYWQWARLRIMPLLDQVRRDQPVLELGCGAGNFLALLRAEGYVDLQGLDLSPEMVAHSRARGLNVQERDAIAYLCESNTRHGLIVALDFLEHFTKVELIELVALVRERLMPGGTFLVQTPNGEGLFPNQVIYGDLTHMTVLTPGSLTHLLRHAGFGRIQCVEAGPVPKSLLGAIRTTLWFGIRSAATAVRLIETGKRQEIWTETFICAARCSDGGV